MNQLKRNWRWIGAIALMAMLLLSFGAAPQAGERRGSTYSRSPSGYGAWYAFMQQQGAAIQRWQKPLEQLIGAPEPTVPPTGLTLLQIGPRLGWLSPAEEDWVRQGHLWIQLGVATPATPAPFRSRLESPSGGVKVETSRRYVQSSAAGSASDPAVKPLLSDAFGAVVWQVALGKGRVVYAATPYLGANAYQQEAGNFAWLAQLVTEADRPIFVNEYLHGYKDAATIAQESAGSLVGYLAKTPLLVVAVQAGVVLLLLVWGQNQRLGPPLPIAPPKLDNSRVYIQALAGVLRQANSSQFVVETVRRAELLEVQRSLGLGATASAAAVGAAWVQQTGRSPRELDPLLWPIQRRYSERELLIWLETIRLVRQQLPS